MNPDSKCQCGYSKEHHMISGHGHYTWTGWFWVLCGVTTQPVRVDYKCRFCQTVIGTTTDKQVLIDFSSQSR